MITEIDAKLLEKIADLTGKPAGAFNIRKDMGCEARQSTEHIAIDPRADGKPGIDIHFKAGTKGETCHIPVIISQTGMSDMVYNDFYVADDCDVNIVAGCGIHNSGCDESRHEKLPGPLHGEALRRGRPGRDRQKRDESPDHRVPGGELHHADGHRPDPGHRLHPAGHPILL